jgi:hypothetical protein
VVLLAAGLDSRAFRLAWPGEVRLFEVDLPDVLSFKQRVLTDQARDRAGGPAWHLVAQARRGRLPGDGADRMAGRGAADLSVGRRDRQDVHNTDHGWLVHTHDRATLAASYGRPDPDETGGGFLTAVRT